VNPRRKYHSLPLCVTTLASATGVLLGRTDLATNPFTQPAIEALGTLGDFGGEGMILDENHNILYHAEADMIMTPYTGEIPESDSKFFSGTSPTACAGWSISTASLAVRGLWSCRFQPRWRRNCP
jgi:hypothetical protein